jgi:hypothetical protein
MKQSNKKIKSKGAIKKNKKVSMPKLNKKEALKLVELNAFSLNVIENMIQYSINDIFINHIIGNPNIIKEEKLDYKVFSDAISDDIEKYHQQVTSSINNAIKACGWENEKKFKKAIDRHMIIYFKQAKESLERVITDYKKTKKKVDRASRRIK